MEVLGHQHYNTTFNLHFVLTEEYCGTEAWRNCYQKDHRGYIQKVIAADEELHSQLLGRAGNVMQRRGRKDWVEQRIQGHKENIGYSIN